MKDSYANVSELSKHVIAGAASGCATSLVTCPLDVVKTRLQSQSILLPNVAIKRVGSENISKLYRGTLWSLRRIWKEEGLKGLYRGLGPTLIGYLPTFAIYFPTYHQAKRTISKCNFLHEQHPFVHLISAMVAGATGTLVTNPLWVVRTRLMTKPMFEDYKYRSTWNGLATIWRIEGWKGMYRGLGPSLLGTFHVAVQFPLYERLKQYFRSRDNDHLSAGTILISSTISKVTAAIITYPHEVLRTRLQTQALQSNHYRGIITTAKTLWREEGLGAFYRGLPTNIVRVIPASAMTFVTYELILMHLDDWIP